MACLVNRKEGKITSVQAPNGKESKLFKEIHANPFLAGSETSLEVYKNSFTDEVESRFESVEDNVHDTGEPRLFTKGQKGVYDSVEEAIIEGESGYLQSGFVDPNTEEFLPVVGFNTEASTRSQFIHSMIGQGFLSPDRILDKDGNTFFEGKGKSITDKKLGANAVKFEAYTEGNARVSITVDGKISIPNNDSVSRVEMKDGSVKYVKVEDSLKEVKESDPVNKAELIYDYLTTVEKVVPDTAADTASGKREVEDLKSTLMNFMKMMGFNSTTLEAYSERYNNIHGQDPDVQALADMGNKLVAFREGRIGVEDLSEEVAHIAIEYYADQNSIASAIASVHMTEEYGDFSEFYRSKYASQFKNDPTGLEEMVRKEVLGKILKNEFSDRFSKENKSQERQTLIDKLTGWWSSFVEFLSTSVNRRHVKEIKRINDKIADSVLSGRVKSFNLNIQSDNVYYNAMSKSSKTIEAKLQVAKKQLEELYKKEMNTDVPNKIALERISDDMNTYNVLSSVNTLTGIASQQSDVLLRSLNKAKEEGVPASREDLLRSVYIQTTKNTFQGIREDLKSMPLGEDQKTVAEQKRFIDGIEKSLAKLDANFNEARPLIDSNDQVTRQRILERALEEGEFTEEQRDQIRSMWDADKKDISFFGFFFGLMSSQKNPVLSLMAKLAKDLKTSVNKTFLNTANSFLSDVSDNNLEQYQKDIVRRDNGKQTYFYRGPQRLDLFNKDLKAKQVELILELKPSLKKATVEEDLNTQSPYSILGTTELQDEYGTRIKEWQKERTESFNNEQYEIEKQERFDKAYISDSTKETISNKNTGIRKRNQRYTDENGNVDNSLKTEADRLQDQNDRNNYRAVLSPLVEGQVREGLKVVSVADLSEQERVELSNALPYDIDQDYKGEVIVPDGKLNSLEDYKKLADNLEDSSRVSLDLNTLNMRYRQELSENERETGFNDQFFTRLKEISEEGSSAFDWATSNGSLTFTSEYFDSLSDENFVGYVDAAERMLADMSESVEKEDKTNSLKQIKSLMFQKKHLSKLYRKDGNPMETDASTMSPANKERIIEIDTEIEGLKSSIKVSKDYFSEQEVELSERVLTQDFYNDVESSGLSIYEFALQNMTDKNSISAREFSLAITGYIKGNQAQIPSFYNDFLIDIEKSGKLKGKTQEEQIQILKDEYSKTKVASYYQKFEPKGATEFLNRLKNPDNVGELEKFLKRDEAFLEENPIAKYLEITPDYTWSQDIGNEEYRNKRYMSDEYYLQPKLVDQEGNPTKYVDQEFFDRYGIDMDSWLENPHLDLSKMEATKNKEEFMYLQKVIGLKEDTLKLYNESTSYSKFQRAQITRSRAEKIAGAFNMNKIGTTKAAMIDSWRDIYRDRADEKLYGETVDTKTLVERGEELNVKAVPKYFLGQLDNPEFLTENTLQAELMMHKEAALYKARVEQESDFNALLRKVETDSIKSTGIGGKTAKISQKGQSSNLYKKAAEYLDYHLYGIKQTRKMQTSILGRNVDLTKVINTLQSFTRFGNLAFNPIVDVTSFTTGQTVNWGDRLAGDYYHKSSFDRALKSTPKVFKYIAESGKLHKRSELNHLLELFTVESIDDRLADSAQGRGIKLLDRSPFGLSKVSNMGIKPQIVFSTLMDVRFIDGKFQSWQQYYNSRKAQDKTISSKQIVASFKSQAKESLYDHLEISKNGISFNEKFSERYENPGAEFDKLVNRLSSKIENMVQITDTVISDTDRLAAQRDVITNQLMMHRGWLPINLTKRFKPEQTNFMTGKVEKGHYRSVAELITKVVKSRSLKRMGEIYAELPEEDRANFKRVRFETGLTAAFILLAQFIFAADDDDDSYMEDVLQYAYLRTAREFYASTILGTGKSVIETMKSPITAIRTLENLEPVTLINNTFGLFKGDYKPTWKTIKNLTVAKRYEQLSDIQKQMDSYFYFNESTVPFRHPVKEERKRQRELRKQMKEQRESEREALRLLETRR